MLVVIPIIIKIIVIILTFDHRCSDDSGKLILTEVKDGPLLQVIKIIMMLIIMVMLDMVLIIMVMLIIKVLIMMILIMVVLATTIMVEDGPLLKVIIVEDDN